MEFVLPPSVHTTEVIDEVLLKLQQPNPDIKVILSNAIELDLYDKMEYQVSQDVAGLIETYVLPCKMDN